MPIILDDYFDDEDRPQPQPNNDDNSQDEAASEEPKLPVDKTDPQEDDFIITNAQRRRSRMRRFGLIALGVVLLAILVNVLFISREAEQGRVRGYMVQMELRKGLVFDSYECTMVVDYPDAVQNDSTLIFRFSATDRELGQSLSNAMRGDSIVLVDYVRYTTKMPWRGRTDTKVDSVDIMHHSVLRTPSKVASDKQRFISDR